MTSINTNASAINALSILRDTNKSMMETQQRISTGLKVSSSKDNASTFSIAQGIRSDMKAFGAIKDSLALGQATLSVATAATKTMSSLADEIRAKIVSAQGDNVDRNVIQDDINQLVAQIDSQVSAAEFNGANLIDGSGSGNFNVMSGFKDDGSAQNISVAYTDLSARAGLNNSIAFDQFGPDTQDSANVMLSKDYATGQFDSMSYTVVDVASGNETTRTVDISGAANLAAVATALQTDLQGLGGVYANSTVSATGEGQLTFGDADAGTVNFRGVAAAATGGGLADLAAIDVSTQAGAASALTSIDSVITTIKSADASLGSAQKRMDLQADFMNSLVDSLKQGLSSLVDADMTEESVKLSQYQAKQQLGVQAMSIANQNTSSILSLFR
ncbi:MAG: flagellin [Alphaproteobacteria bacterium]|nr:flagellin [Alphaproteobacteria bacterium]